MASARCATGLPGSARRKAHAASSPLGARALPLLSLRWILRGTIEPRHAPRFARSLRDTAFVHERREESHFLRSTRITGTGWSLSRCRLLEESAAASLSRRRAWRVGRKAHAASSPLGARALPLLSLRWILRGTIEPRHAPRFARSLRDTAFVHERREESHFLRSTRITGTGWSLSRCRLLEESAAASPTWPVVCQWSR